MGPVVEVGAAQDVAPAAADVARLRVARRAGLLLPVAVVLLDDQAHLAFVLAVPAGPRGDRARVVVAGRVGAVARGQRVQELWHLRLDLAADGRHAERAERDDVAVVLADPVDEPVAASVAVQDVDARAAVRAVLEDRMGVGRVVQRVVRREVVVGVEDVVAPAAVQVVAPGSAEHPVVAQVAEQEVGAVVVRWRVRRRARAVAREGAAAEDDPAVRIRRRRVEEELAGRRLRARQAGAVAVVRVGRAAPLRAVGVEQDGAARVVLVVEVELAEARLERLVREPRVGVVAEAQQVARVVRPGPVRVDEAVRDPARAEVLDV